MAAGGRRPAIRRSFTGPPRGRRRWYPRLPFRPIVGGFLLAAAGVTALTAWVLWTGLRFPPLVAYLAGINLATFGAYLYDKSVAGNDRGLLRVPEAALHALALAGGTPAALAGQRLLRHKTHKRPFGLWFWSIAVLQGVVAVLWFWQRGIV